MNEVSPRPRRKPTQAAEGLPRWRWTLAEFDRFIDIGIFDADDRIELIGGELVQMNARGIAHETVKTDLKDWLIDRLASDQRVESELAWRPDESTYCEPDLAIFPRRIRPVSTVPGSEILLLIEVADTTLKKDTTTKALLYATLGVREYWVIDALAHVTYVFRQPTREGYRQKRRVAKDKVLKPTLLAGIALRLADLPFTAG